MKILIQIFFNSMLIARSFAGTDVGCVRDQWSDKDRTVNRTGTFWEIHVPGGAGCKTVSKPSSSHTEVSMKNSICSFHFSAKSAVLSIGNVKTGKCSCAGTFPLEVICVAGLGGKTKTVCEGPALNENCRFETNEEELEAELRKRNNEIRKNR
jgi:hypothetical protein